MTRYFPTKTVVYTVSTTWTICVDMVESSYVHTTQTFFHHYVLTCISRDLLGHCKIDSLFNRYPFFNTSHLTSVSRRGCYYTSTIMRKQRFRPVKGSSQRFCYLHCTRVEEVHDVSFSILILGWYSSS